MKILFFSSFLIFILTKICRLYLIHYYLSNKNIMIMGLFSGLWQMKEFVLLLAESIHFCSFFVWLGLLFGNDLFHYFYFYFISSFSNLFKTLHVNWSRCFGCGYNITVDVLRVITSKGNEKVFAYFSIELILIFILSLFFLYYYRFSFSFIFSYFLICLFL